MRISQLNAAGALSGTELLVLSQLSVSVTITAATISAQASDNSYNDSGNGFVAAGFTVGKTVRVTGFTGNTANNIFSAVVTAVTAGKLTIGGTDGDVIVDEAAGESVTITQWNTVSNPVESTKAQGTVVETILYETTLDSTATSIDTGTFATDGKDLKILLIARTDRAETTDNVLIAFNADTTNANYYRGESASYDTTIAAFEAADRVLGGVAGANAPANCPGTLAGIIHNYAGTWKKNLICDGGINYGEASSQREQLLLTWLNTAAISRIQVFPSIGPNFVAGTYMRVSKTHWT